MREGVGPQATKLVAITLAAGLSVGCSHEEQVPIKPVVAGEVWNKPGGTDEEFRRTRARCMAQAEVVGGGNESAVLYCLRQEGWTPRLP
jgi:hypothetical protein